MNMGEEFEKKSTSKERLEVLDSTLRDGTQMAGIAFSLKDKMRITERLDDLGIDYIEGGWPGSNPKDIEFFRAALKLNLKKSRLTAFASTRYKGGMAATDPNILALLKSEVTTATIFGKSWDLHVLEALKTTLDENLKMIYDTVSFLYERGLDIIYDAEHFFDGYKNDAEYAMKTIKAAIEGGAKTIVLCDTNGGSLPYEINSIVETVNREVKGVQLGIHTHNDADMAVANTVMGIQGGATHLQGTINGFGERCGNADLCSVLPVLQLSCGHEILDKGQLKRLTDVSRFVYEMANISPPTNKPFVGKNAFAHKGGIHVSAMRRNSQTYEHIEPEKVGNRRRILVSELSGQSNLVEKAEEMGIDLGSDPKLLKKVLQRVKDMEFLGYQFEAAEASFELLVKKVREEYRELFQLEDCKIITQKIGNGSSNSEAVIKVKVMGHTMHNVAEGEGPVNALDNALRKVLREFYPALDLFRLVDYKVRVLDGRDGTASRVRVIIQSSDGKNTWSNVGVSENIIEASWQALVDSIEYGLIKYNRAEAVMICERKNCLPIESRSYNEDRRDTIYSSS